MPFSSIPGNHPNIDGHIFLTAGEGQKLVQENDVTSTNTVLTTQSQYSHQATVIESPKPKKKKRGNGDKIIQGILVVGVLLMLTFSGKQ